MSRPQGEIYKVKVRLPSCPNQTQTRFAQLYKTFCILDSYISSKLFLSSLTVCCWKSFQLFFGGPHLCGLGCPVNEKENFDAKTPLVSTGLAIVFSLTLAYSSASSNIPFSKYNFHTCLLRLRWWIIHKRWWIIISHRWLITIDNRSSQSKVDDDRPWSIMNYHQWSMNDYHR
jgi:hypothetical protein